MHSGPRLPHDAEWQTEQGRPASKKKVPGTRKGPVAIKGRKEPWRLRRQAIGRGRPHEGRRGEESLDCTDKRIMSNTGVHRNTLPTREPDFGGRLKEDSRPTEECLSAKGEGSDLKIGEQNRVCLAKNRGTFMGQHRKTREP